MRCSRRAGTIVALEIATGAQLGTIAYSARVMALDLGAAGGAVNDDSIAAEGARFR